MAKSASPGSREGPGRRIRTAERVRKAAPVAPEILAPRASHSSTTLATTPHPLLPLILPRTNMATADSPGLDILSHPLEKITLVGHDGAPQGNIPRHGVRDVPDDQRGRRLLDVCIAARGECDDVEVAADGAGQRQKDAEDGGRLALHDGSGFDVDFVDRLVSGEKEVAMVERLGVRANRRSSYVPDIFGARLDPAFAAPLDCAPLDYQCIAAPRDRDEVGAKSRVLPGASWFAASVSWSSSGIPPSLTALVNRLSTVQALMAHLKDYVRQGDLPSLVLPYLHRQLRHGVCSKARLLR